jgi:hypothetical protein
VGVAWEREWVGGLPGVSLVARGKRRCWRGAALQPSQPPPAHPTPPPQPPPPPASPPAP